MDGLDELAAVAGVTRYGLRSLLHYLVALDLLEHRGEDRFALTELGEALRAREDGYDLERGRGRAVVFPRLVDSIRTGAPAYDLVHGRSFWEDLDQDPQLAESWATMFGQHAEMLAPRVAELALWSSVETFVDVGGGSATLLITLLERHGHLRGTVVDLERPAALARATIRERSLEDRATVLSRSFFEPLPAADVYLLSWILHDWPDEAATTILANCARSGAAGTQVLVVEQPVDPDGPDRTMASMALWMLALFGGRERSGAEFDALAIAAGLEPVEATELVDGYSAMHYRTAAG